jgi:hypothetical protein
MGGEVSSLVPPSELTASRLDATLNDDVRVLERWTDSDIADPKWVHHTFPEAATAGIIQLPQALELFAKKYPKCLDKLKDSDLVLTSRVSQNSLDMFLRKKLKYTQR